MTVLGRLRRIPSRRLIRRARTRRSRQPRSARSALRLLCPIGPLPVRSDCRGDHARAAARAFDKLYGAKWPKATAKITDDVDELLAFYDHPAEHWIHLRTTQPQADAARGADDAADRSGHDLAAARRHHPYRLR
jgi:hypothetical protein